MELTSIKDIENYINSQKGQEHILTLDNVQKVLSHEAKRLEQYLKDELQSYFDSYKPKVYDRTGNTMASIRVGEPKYEGGLGYSCEISFDESLAYHPSYIGEDQPKGNTIWLLNSGWRTRRDSIRHIDNLTSFQGTNFIGHAVDMFNRNNPYGITVTVYKDNQEVSGYYSYGHHI